MTTTALADESAVATDAPPTWRELIAARSDHGPPVVEGTTTEEAIEAATATGEAASERGGPTDPESPALVRWWVLLAPLAGAVVLSAVSWSFDPNPLRTGTSPPGLLAFAVLIPFFLVCTAGTLAVFRDATRLRAAGAEWSPTPWHYVVPSAVVLAAIHVLSAGRTTGGTEEMAGFLAGSLLVALVASSILAGPAYLLQRRRRLGED